MKTAGLVYIFTGNGKGKTSAALGMLTRALAHGWKVGWISWYKEASWGISEHKLDTIFSKETLKRLTFLPMGKGFYLKKKKMVRANAAVIVDNDTPAEHKLAAVQALREAQKLLRNVDVLVLDEICNAISDGLLKESNVRTMLQKRGTTHVILTGRNASSLLIQTADLVSSIDKIKHPFDAGKLAVKGLDF